MKIQGVIQVEGVELHVDIEAPDDQKELYVTNVHPDCLVIPKERWKVEFLGLPVDALIELQMRGVTTLGQLVDETWNIGASGLSEGTKRKVQEALTTFRQIALVFERPKQYDAPAAKIRQPGVGPTNNKNVELSLSEVGLLKNQEEALRSTRKVATYGDLIALGRGRLMMTNQMDERAVAKIETALRSVGLELPD